MDRFLGVGIVNATGLAIFTILLIVVLKVIFAKWQVPGVTDVMMVV